MLARSGGSSSTSSEKKHAWIAGCYFEGLGSSRAAEANAAFSEAKHAGGFYFIFFMLEND